MSVVEFPRSDPRIWVCACGCSTFNVREDGTVMCASCDHVSGADIDGGWYDVRKGAPEADCEPVSDVQGNGSVEFARRRIGRLVMEDSVVAVAVVRVDGSISGWTSADTKERVAWVKRQIRKAGNLFKAVRA